MGFFVVVVVVDVVVVVGMVGNFGLGFSFVLSGVVFVSDVGGDDVTDAVEDEDDDNADHVVSGSFLKRLFLAVFLSFSKKEIFFFRLV